MQSWCFSVTRILQIQLETPSCDVQHVEVKQSWQCASVPAVIKLSVINMRRLEPDFRLYHVLHSCKKRPTAIYFPGVSRIFKFKCYPIKIKPFLENGHSEGLAVYDCITKLLVRHHVIPIPQIGLACTSAWHFKTYLLWGDLVRPCPFLGTFRNFAVFSVLC